MASAQNLNGEASQPGDTRREDGPRSTSTPKLRSIDKSTDAFELIYFDPPPGLERYILTLFDVRFLHDPMEARHPGALGQLSLTVQGTATAQFGERTEMIDNDAVLFNAFEVAVPYRAEGPLWCVGASLSPYGWAALTQISLKDGATGSSKPGIGWARRWTA
jgi:hypothetical protein